MKHVLPFRAGLRWLVLASAGTTAAAHGAADLTELSLEQLLDVPVVSASRFSQKTSETAATVSVVTHDEIRQYGWRTLTEVLRSLRGFYTISDRGYDYIGTRNFARPQDYNTRLLLLVDGQRVNDAIYDQAYIGTDGIIDLDLVDRIEVIRGPGSSIYGSNAVFGVVNLITRRGASFTGGEVATRVSSYDTVEGRASLGKRLDNGDDLLLSVSGMNSTGPSLYFPEFNTADHNYGWTSHTDYTRVGRFFARYSTGDLSITTAASRRTKGVPTGDYGAEFNDRGHAYIDTQAYLAVDHQLRLASGADLTTHAYVSDYDYSAEARHDTPSVRTYDEAHGTWYGLDLKLVSTLSERDKLVAGIEYQRNAHQNQTNYDAAPYRLYTLDRRQSERSGVFLQNDFQWTPDLKLSVGGRYDLLTDQSGQFNPRLGAVYRFSPQTVGKLQYGTAFRAPNVYERYYHYPDAVVANPQLQPEKIHTIEASVEHYLDPQTRLLGTAFAYRLDKLIDQRTDPATGLLQYANIGRARTHGIELEVERMWQNGTRLRASLDLQHAHGADDEDLTNAPRAIGRVNLSAPLPWYGLRAGTEAQWMSSRLSYAGEVPAYGVVNVTLLRPLNTDRWEWSLSVFNLLDNRYYDASAFDPAVPTRDRFAQDGRSYRLKALFRF